MTVRFLMALVALLIADSTNRSFAEPPHTDVTKIAVFGFELQDNSPGGGLGMVTTKDASLDKATAAARELLESSGRYAIVNIDAVDLKSVTQGRALRDCNGCEAAAARDLGAQQSLIGYVRRATQTDYYIVVVIRDAKTGEIVNAQVANFAGGEEGWASGVRKLIKHQVLSP